MTKSNVFSARIPMFILFFIAFAFTSCKKEERQALKDIEGTWNIESYTTNVAPAPQSITGTWTFNKCKKRDNKKFNCDGVFDYTVTYLNDTQTLNQAFKYSLDVSKSGAITAYIDDIIYDLEVSETTMTASVDAGGEAILIVFKR